MDDEPKGDASRQPSELGRRSFLKRGAIGLVAVGAAATAVELVRGGASEDGSPSATSSDDVGPSSSASSASTDRTSGPVSWSIPDAANVRELGVAPPGPCGPFADPQCAGGPANDGLRGLAIGNALSVPGLGIPLGGAGAGSFMYNLYGTFGPWNMGGRQNSFWEQRTLPQAAFHVREQLEGDGATVRTLTTPQSNVAAQRQFGAVLPAWTQLEPGDGSYAALYPFGWTTYRTFSSDVSMRLWSPMIAREDERTSMPVAFFEVRLANPAARPVELSVMLTFPNVSPHVGTTPPTVRQGLYTREESDAGTGVVGVTLGSDDPGNTIDAARSAWTIAVRPGPDQHVSHLTSWDAQGDGSDVYAAFTSTGRLPDTALDSSGSAAAIAVSVRLEPGESTVIPFALSWDFPQVEYGTNEATSVWMRRYTGFLGGTQTDTNDYVAGSYPFDQSFRIAARELARLDDSLAAVERWWSPIATDGDLPAWLRGSALNELYHVVFNNSFWEAGLVSTTQELADGGPRLGSVVPGTHLFGTLGCGSGGDPTYAELDVDSYAYLAYCTLFPSLERGRLLAWLQQIAQNPVGRPMQNAVMHTGPYITARASTALPSPGAPPTEPAGFGVGGDSYRDVPHKVIYRLYALFRETGDETLITHGFAPMLSTLTYIQAFRPDGSHLPTDPPTDSAPSTYDQIVVDGHGVYNAQLYLLSLEIMSALAPIARKLGVAEASVELEATLAAELVAAKEEFERTFWNPATGRYRFCDGLYGITGRAAPYFGAALKFAPPTDAVFLDAFFAQGIAAQLGLPDLIDQDRMRTHLRGTMEAFMTVNDAMGRPAGPPLVLDADLQPYLFDTSFPLIELPEVWVGTTYMAAAAAVRAATRDDDIVSMALRMAESVSNQVNDDANAFLFNTPEGWFVNDVSAYRYPAYSRGTAVWQLVDALAARGK